MKYKVIHQTIVGGDCSFESLAIAKKFAREFDGAQIIDSYGFVRYYVKNNAVVRI